MPDDEFGDIAKKIIDMLNNIDSYTMEEMLEKIDEEQYERIDEYIERILSEYDDEIYEPLKINDRGRGEIVRQIEINDYGDKYTITIHIPGVKDDEIETRLDDGKFVIDIKEKGYHEEVPIDVEVEPDFKRTYRNGVLDIIFKKKGE